MISFLADVANNCTNNDGLLNVLKLVRMIIRYLQILIPIALILWGTIDMGKAVIAGDEKKMKEAQKPFVKRLISAIIVFLIPFIVNLTINLVLEDANDWRNCWNAAGEGDYEPIDPNLSENETTPAQ